MRQKAELKDEILRVLKEFAVIEEQSQYRDMKELVAKVQEPFVIVRALVEELQRAGHADQSLGFLVGITNEGQSFLDFEGGYIAAFEKDQTIKDREGRQVESIIQTNESVLLTNKMQIWALGITAIFSAASLVVSLLTYFKTDKIIVNPTPVTINNQVVIPTSDTAKQALTTIKR